MVAVRIYAALALVWGTSLWNDQQKTAAYVANPVTRLKAAPLRPQSLMNTAAVISPTGAEIALATRSKWGFCEARTAIEKPMASPVHTGTNPKTGINAAQPEYFPPYNKCSIGLAKSH